MLSKIDRAMVLMKQSSIFDHQPHLNYSKERVIFHRLAVFTSFKFDGCFWWNPASCLDMSHWSRGAQGLAIPWGTGDVFRFALDVLSREPLSGMGLILKRLAPS